MILIYNDEDDDVGAVTDAKMNNFYLTCIPQLRFSKYSVTIYAIFFVCELHSQSKFRQTKKCRRSNQQVYDYLTKKTG